MQHQEEFQQRLQHLETLMQKRKELLEMQRGPNTFGRLTAKVGRKGVAVLFLVVLLTGLAAGITVTPLASKQFEGFSTSFSTTDLTVTSIDATIIAADEWSIDITIVNDDTVQHDALLTVSISDAVGVTLATETQSINVSDIAPANAVFSLSGPDIVEQSVKFGVFLEQTS